MLKQLTGWSCLLVLVSFSMEALAVKLQSLDFASLPDSKFEVRLGFSGKPPKPDGYTVDNPARIVLDLPGVENGIAQKKHALSLENARSAVVLGAADRTRLILNLEKIASYESRVEGNVLKVLVGAASVGSIPSRASKVSGSRQASNVPVQGSTASIKKIDFQRNSAGEGLVVIDLSDPSIAVDVTQVGRKLKMRFLQANLPNVLDRKLDVVDFGTPVSSIDASQSGNTTEVIVDAQGEYDYMAYQTDSQYVLSVKPLTPEEVEEQKNKFAYVGEKLSLNFQNIEVRSVLQLIADFTDLNLVASDTVAGSITLRLENVPWDQALAIVLKAKGLDKRQEGNVLMVAPAAEIAERERLQVEANKQIEELAPLRTEFVRIKYADAKKMFALFDGEGGDSGGESDGEGGESTQSILSSRGSAIVDERTNTIILTDTEEKIAQFKRLIDEIDVPVRQVLIEARIVVASSDLKEELGFNWGLGAVRNPKGGVDGDIGSLVIGATGGNPSVSTGSPASGLDFDTSVVSLGLSPETATSKIGIGILRKNTFINLELSALEDEGKTEIVSQPKVLTGDKQKAVIKSGEQVAFQKATSSGATSVEFKEAVLQLEVTPQITPDGRIVMDLYITQDTVGKDSANDELPPNLIVNQLETQAIVGDGQTLVLGGFFKTTQNNSVRKVPLLGDLPILGTLFRSTQDNLNKTELLIFVTPKIVNDKLID